MHILITGGTGFIGRHLADFFLSQGHKISILSRQTQRPATLDGEISLITQLDHQQSYSVIINLAGAPLNQKRWSKSVKENILNSRLSVTKSILHYLQQCEHKPKLLISGSAIGFYGEAQEQVFSETTLPATYDFPHQLCQKWEQTALQAEPLGTRVCLLRTGIVLGPHGGVLEKMWWPFKLGLGAKLGNGKQWMSWIHIKDMVLAINYLMINNWQGPVNLVAPNAVTNAEFSAVLAKQFNKRCWFSMPALFARMLFGEMGEKLLLQGQHVVPERLQAAGYKFQFDRLEPALNDIACNWSKPN